MTAEHVGAKSANALNIVLQSSIPLIVSASSLANS